jgi:hypothetical protein
MTQQIADTVAYNGETYYTYSNPFHQYRFTFKPKERPRFYGEHTANWNGYESDYNIKDNKLFLMKFKGNLSNPKDNTYRVIGLDHFFPGQNEVFADWFTGSLTLHTEAQLYEHDRLDNSYSQDELYLEFKNGELVASGLINSKVADIINNRERELWDIKHHKKRTSWWYVGRKFFNRWIFFDDEFYS